MSEICVCLVCSVMSIVKTLRFEQYLWVLSKRKRCVLYPRILFLVESYHYITKKKMSKMSKIIRKQGTLSFTSSWRMCEERETASLFSFDGIKHTHLTAMFRDIKWKVLRRILSIYWTHRQHIRLAINSDCLFGEIRSVNCN